MTEVLHQQDFVAARKNITSSCFASDRYGQAAQADQPARLRPRQRRYFTTTTLFREARFCCANATQGYLLAHMVCGCFPGTTNHFA